MIGFVDERRIASPFDDVADSVAARVGDLAARILHSERLETGEGKRVYQWAGVSRPVRASGFFPVFMQGMRYSMFYVRLEDLGDGCILKAAAGGGETWTGFDFGRNRNLADFLLDITPGADS